MHEALSSLAHAVVCCTPSAHHAAARRGTGMRVLLALLASRLSTPRAACRFEFEANGEVISYENDSDLFDRTIATKGIAAILARRGRETLQVMDDYDHYASEARMADRFVARARDSGCGIDQFCDWVAYGRRYSDLYHVFDGNVTALRRHFLEYGRAEGRDCAAFTEEERDSTASFYSEARGCDMDGDDGSVAKAQGPFLAYILRGFLYHETRTPDSASGRKQSYAQDIRELWDTHEELIEVFRRKYVVLVYFATYSDCPRDVLDWARARGSIILVDLRNVKQFAKQFTTVTRALEQIPNHDAYFVTRTDITFFASFRVVVGACDHPPLNIMVLNKELGGKGVDVVHYFSASNRELFYNYLSGHVNSLSHQDAHDLGTIHKARIGYLTDEITCRVRCRNKYYTLLGYMDERCQLKDC